MKRTYEVHFTVKGVTTVSFDDYDFDTIDHKSVARDIFCGLPEEAKMCDIDLDTLDISETKEISGD